MEIAQSLEQKFSLDQAINIHLTGCHHSCAQHYIGDIGLLACQVERGEDMIDGYHVHLGGGWGERKKVARLLFQSVAYEEIVPLLAAIISGYLANRQADEPFVDFANRHDDQQLRSFAAVTT
jgi:ferredoxin-nitrite reductase